MKRLGIMIITMIWLLVSCKAVEVNNKTKNVEDTQEQNQYHESIKGYYFNYKNTDIGIDMLINKMVETIGKPDEHRERYSDELQGNFKIYDYGSFEINTLETDNEECIIAISFKDDLVSTAEDICLYMTKEDVIEAYGNKYKEEKNVFVYEKDGMKLRFIFEDEYISHIDYFSSMVY